MAADVSVSGGKVRTPVGDAPVLPLLLFGIGGFLMWYGVHYWRSQNTRWASDPIKSVLQGKGLPPNVPAQSPATTVATYEGDIAATAAPVTGAAGASTSGPSGKVYSFAQLRSYWIMAGGPLSAADTAAAVALAESSGNPDSTNPTDNNGRQTSWGLWQISLGNHNPPAPDWNNPLTNARLAVAKYNAAGGTFAQDWGTYISGAYRKYLPGGG
jgi:Lysozyme like domain